MRETIKSFRKRFSRLIGDLKYFMNFGPSHDAELKSICDCLARTEIVGQGGYLRTGLEHMSLILTGETLASYNSHQNFQNLATPHRISKGSNRSIENAEIIPQNLNSRRQSVGIGIDSTRQTHNHGSNLSSEVFRPYQDPRGTIEKVIIDGDTKHNTPNRYIRSRPASVNHSGMIQTANGSARSIGPTIPKINPNVNLNIHTPVNNKGMKDSDINSGRQISASWRKAGSRSDSHKKLDSNQGSVSRKELS
jgi:hypothetical protein